MFGFQAGLPNQHLHYTAGAEGPALLRARERNGRQDGGAKVFTKLHDPEMEVNLHIVTAPIGFMFSVGHQR